MEDEMYMCCLEMDDSGVDIKTLMDSLKVFVSKGIRSLTFVIDSETLRIIGIDKAIEFDIDGCKNISRRGFFSFKMEMEERKQLKRLIEKYGVPSKGV